THRYRKYFAKVLNNAPELKGKNTHIIVNSLINSSSITRDNPKYQDDLPMYLVNNMTIDIITTMQD
ncbi:hypothetical protein Pmar_PMAR002118, partial [Perkinsus marinus ATCC 50983]